MKFENRDKVRAYARKCRTGWTNENFEKAWIEQKGLCGICKITMLKTGSKSNSVCADHNHDDNQQRGLLCSRCNSGLGFYERFHKQCALYLKKHAKRNSDV